MLNYWRVVHLLQSTVEFMHVYPPIDWKQNAFKVYDKHVPRISTCTSHGGSRSMWCKELADSRWLSPVATLGCTEHAGVTVGNRQRGIGLASGYLIHQTSPNSSCLNILVGHQCIISDVFPCVSPRLGHARMGTAQIHRMTNQQMCHVPKSPMLAGAPHPKLSQASRNARVSQGLQSASQHLGRLELKNRMASEALKEAGCGGLGGRRPLREKNMWSLAVPGGKQTCDASALPSCEGGIVASIWELGWQVTGRLTFIFIPHLPGEGC